ncbi:hypothetical protein GT347_06905 [Xylophilus rhododendri]|uniref:Uncharacterized protein n=1 Tax=Xylophilus rhododendri TaxID=2697032 RepID=A0A857J3W1_9BURK|nr:hypothetical protein [Xylophilus rhododendri]QHI97742.1 hypothetical protein GT347_06905 [Xylophilus rhododendri]
MVSVSRFLGTSGLALAFFMAGCGGGGGNGGTVYAPISVSLQVNGAAVTPSASGEVAVAPGDSVSIGTDQASTWSTSASDSSAITVAKASTTTQLWSGQLVNGTTSAVTYTVTATSVNGSGNTKAVVLKVGAGDSRNGSYSVFATNGSNQKLAINFDTKSLVMTDENNVAASATISANASEAGTWDITSPLNPNTTNTARLRVAADGNNIVGSFPFAVAFASPVRYAVTAFVASRALVTTAAQLDGVYNRLGIDITATGRDSNIRQVRVRGAGTIFETCNSVAVTAMASCSSFNTYTVTPNTTAGSWHIVNNADATDIGNFRIAVIGGQNVYFGAGAVVPDGPTRVFRIGPQDISTFANVTARGADTLGAWGKADVTSTSLASTGVDTTGTAYAVNLDLNTLASIGPLGMRGGTSREIPANKFFVTQGAKIGAVVGARTNTATQGYIQIGLID